MTADLAVTTKKLVYYPRTMALSFEGLHEINGFSAVFCSSDLGIKSRFASWLTTY